MITGFLFFTKILNAEKRPIDWTQLYASRILRLLPLYLVAMAGMFLIVAILSDWKINQPLPALALGIVRWLSFTISGAPDLNGITDTSRILASVTWSLRFEWSFYILLPSIAFLMGSRPPKGYLILSVVGLALLLAMTPEPVRFLAFFGGMAAAFVVRFPKIAAFCALPINGLTIVLCLALTVIFFTTAYEITPMVLLSIAFTMVAGGNTGFGIFASHTSRLLGELAYGIYLLHGLLLFSIFRFGIGFEKAANLDPRQFWTIIAVSTPALIVITFAAFKYVEKPSMKMVPSLTAWLKRNQNDAPIEKAPPSASVMPQPFR
jgi:peptidoglycan/LPS O-acetylase OafA/YrhL